MTRRRASRASSIDLVDESAARLRTEIDSKPEELDEADRKVLQLEIERQALKKESAQASRDRLAKLEEELAGLRETADRLRAQWEAEKGGIGKVRDVKQRIEATRRAIEQAEREYDLNKVAELKYGTLADLERQLAAAETHEAGGKRLLKEEVDEEDIAEVVARWTGIPVAKLVEGEREKLLLSVPGGPSGGKRTATHGETGGQSGMVDGVKSLLRAAANVVGHNCAAVGIPRRLSAPAIASNNC